MENKKTSAVEFYNIGKVSLGLAAQLSGLILSEFIDLLREYGMTLLIDTDDVRSALEYVRKAL